MRTLVPALAAVLSLTVPAAGAADLKPLTFDALRTVVTVREPQISPDGTRVAYVRGTSDYKTDRVNSELVVIDAAGGGRRVLTRERDGVHEPKWSPSGDRIAYLASPEHGKPPQLYVLPMNGGDSLRATDVKSGVRTYAWRPDGNAFAYAAEDDPPKAKPAGYVPAFRVTDEHVLTREPSRPVHLWTVDADGKNAKQVTKGDASPSPQSGDLAWMPDGRRLVVALQPDPVFAHFTQMRTSFVDVATGAIAPLPLDGPNAQPAVSHDGRFVAIAVPRHKTVYLQSDMSVRDASDGHEVRSGLAIDRNVHGAVWLPHDAGLLVSTADGVHDVLWRLSVAAGAPERIDLGALDALPGATVARDGTIAFIGASTTDPGEVYVLPAAAHAPRALTDENRALGGYALGRRERFDWTGDDGTKLNGVLTYPAAYTPGRTYPLVLDIHGGPVSTSTLGLAGLEPALDEILANDGFFVLQPNYRGSDNEGDAFLSAIVPHVTSGPGRDNLGAVEALKKTGMIDPARIGVSGWSGGGLQTSWLIGHATYWKAAVTGAGVDDWYEQALLADINENFAATFFGGATPWTAEGRALYREESPITYADKIVTPLLILSDTGDQRVPITQSYALYRALHERGKRVSFVAFPRAGHFPSDPVGRESVLKHWAGWFERWLK